jgi:ribosome biogenesis GTPase / thiamine phosphate phosphatase
MSREERKLRKHFEESSKRELRKANKHMSKVRAGEWKPPRERVDAGWIDDVEEQASAPPKKRISKDHAAASLAHGMAVETGPGFCDVLCLGERVRCRTAVDVATGDQVRFSPDRRRIEEVLPRRTVLSRSDPHNPRIERVIAANIDVVVNVVSLKNPPLRPGLIDRYLIAIGKSGAEALVCVNKIDLLENADEFAPLAPYESLGPIIRCSAITGEGIAQLSDALAGKPCVFAGHSGVGKSSLLNALDSGLTLDTSAVSSGNQRGRHTTTSSALYHLPNGAMIIDTPGIREFGLWNISSADVRGYYREFEGRPCAFGDCSHTHEPDCGVKAAVEAGEIARARYEGYLRILQTMN